MHKLLTNEFEDKYEMVKYINDRPISKDQIVEITYNPEGQLYSLFWYEDEEVTDNITRKTQRRMAALEKMLGN